MYKHLHRTVLLDDGDPNLKKTAFRMPGYRQVMQKGASVTDSQAEIKEYDGIAADDSATIESETEQESIDSP